MSTRSAEIVRLLLEERLTEQEVADRLGIHRNTVARAKKIYDQEFVGWWNNHSAYCIDCEQEIDPNRELSESARKRLFTTKEPLCQECKAVRRRQYNREKQAEWREANREEYNEYMRKWRKKNKEQWKEIKRRSYKKNS